MKRRVANHIESWLSLIPFRISRHTWDDFPCVVCEISQDDRIGRGEALGVYYLGEDTRSMLAQLDAVAGDLADGAGRQELLELLPPGGARCAADAALWDLEAQLSGRSAWETAGVSPAPLQSTMTIGLEDEPAEMAAKAAAVADIALLKIKLNSDRPVERIAAIREVRPDANIIVDVNEGWDFAQLTGIVNELAELGVEMIEQPLPRGSDGELEGFDSPVPLCADESCQHIGELEQAARGYQLINIKLDKCGGLTHGLEFAAAIEALGLGLMAGCMGGTSLCMAPIHVLGQKARYVDIDGPLLLKNDRAGGLVYCNGIAALPEQRFWGV